jgi:Flp pilus assembly protein TadD
VQIQCLPASFFITYASARLAVGQDEPALQIAQKGLTYHPDDHVLLFTLARCLDKVGAVTKCEQVLQRCIELDPTEISYRIYRASTFFFFGKYWNVSQQG